MAQVGPGTSTIGHLANGMLGCAGMRRPACRPWCTLLCSQAPVHPAAVTGSTGGLQASLMCAKAHCWVADVPPCRRQQRPVSCVRQAQLADRLSVLDARLALLLSTGICETCKWAPESADRHLRCCGVQR